jgi:L-lactate dehydrogenase complex protein LldF
VREQAGFAHEEFRLNAALTQAGITAIETDLAELIIQLAGESSSHILVPAIHKIRALFRQTIARGQDLTDQPMFCVMRSGGRRSSASAARRA